MNKTQGFTVSEIKEKLEYYCAYQDRCHWEVEQKLNEFSLIPEARDEIIIGLIQDDFLNEERFVKSFVRGRFNQKQWGRIKIRQELKRRKVGDNLIKIGFKEINEDDYLETLQKLIAKKGKTITEKNSYRKKQKLIRYLLQKGFEYELIKIQLNDSL